MKHLLCSLIFLSFTCGSLAAGDKGCFLFPGKAAKRSSGNCSPATGGMPSVGNPAAPRGQYYKAKDGSIREMRAYWDAVNRADEADQLEPALKQTQEELAAVKTQAEQAATALAAAKAEAETLRQELAKLTAAMEAQAADLKKQVESAKTAAATQKDRADKAEAAHKAAVDEVATLREDAKRNAETLEKTRADLKAALAERDGLVVKAEDLQKALTAAETSSKEAQEELEKLKKAADEAAKNSDKPEDAPKAENNQPGDNAGN
ncbi:MAG: hypothetical protein RLZZ436_386 [Planctomycetota bacterium]|jgi:chromosome segregation ATPase